jgi:hypothetical protein
VTQTLCLLYFQFPLSIISLTSNVVILLFRLMPRGLSQERTNRFLSLRDLETPILGVVEI